MTRALAFNKLVEDSIYFADRETRNITGSIGDLTEFQSKLDAFADAFDGLYCFLAFHPSVDKAVAEYVTAGSLGSDAGRHILALFISGEELRQPRAVKTGDLLSGLHIDSAIHPAYEMVMWLFPEGRRPVLPGLVVFGGTMSSDEIVFVSLAAEQDMQGVAALCRKAFVTAESCWSKGPESLFDRICAELRRDRIEYERHRSMSLREWLVASIEFVKAHKDSITSAVFDIAKKAL